MQMQGIQLGPCSTTGNALSATHSQVWVPELVASAWLAASASLCQAVAQQGLGWVQGLVTPVWECQGRHGCSIGSPSPATQARVPIVCMSSPPQSRAPLVSMLPPTSSKQSLMLP